MLAKLPKHAQKSTIKASGSSYGIGIVPCIPKFYYMKKVVFLSFVAMALFTIGCSKDKGNDGASERMTLITSAAWKYDNAQIDYDKNGTPDMGLPPGLLEDCDKDNIITFNNDGTGTIDEGSTKCDMGNPQSVGITWEFKDDAKVINIPENIFGNFSGDAQIKTLTATKLTLVKSIHVDDPIPADVNVILDLKH